MRRFQVNSILVFTVGIFLLTNFFGITEVKSEILFGYSFIIFSIIEVSAAFRDSLRGKIFIFTILFLIGILFLLISYFEILMVSQLIFPSSLFILGSAFLMLHIENPKGFILLIVAVIFYISTFLVMNGNSNSTTFHVANRLSNVILDYWPLWLIIISVGTIMQKRNS